MSPKALDPNIRTALIETAARLLAEGGPGALTTRRLANEVGTSTMAVYTYFRGMDELRHAVRLEGFDRLAAYLDEVPVGDDPVAEIVELGGAYCLNAITNPHLYRFMFTEKPIDDDPDVGLATFERLVAGVERAVEAGRFSGEPWALAEQLWAMAHGVVTLHLAGLLTLEEAVACIRDMAFNLFVGFGADRESLRDSIEKGQARFGIVQTVASTVARPHRRDALAVE